MLGFNITIVWTESASSTVTSTDDSAVRGAVDREHVLASWTVRPSGLHFFDRLTAEGAARQLQSNGYPTVYTLPAHLVPPPERDKGG